MIALALALFVETRTLWPRNTLQGQRTATR
jgi:hypothetical protein